VNASISSALRRGPLCAGVAALGLIGACWHHAATDAPLPALRSAPLMEPAPPVTVPERAATLAAPLPEKTITMTGEWDVRLALEEIARNAGYSLSLSPQVVSKKVRLSLVNVPSSEALKTVLAAGGLTLQASNGLQIPWDPSVVFYQLPVNVDSLSIDAITKRFGISRELAQLMIDARKP
jgi:hypothetical protein